jgi:hypothetical protein
MLTSWISCSAALMSIIFERYITPKYGKTFVLMIGSICFACVILPFVLFPIPNDDNYSSHNNSTTITSVVEHQTVRIDDEVSSLSSSSSVWAWYMLFFIYTMHGTGCSTFESTWKAIFVDYFFYEKEGAFANIILQNGFAGSIGYLCSALLPCRRSTHHQDADNNSPYCVLYSDGTQHDIGTFESMILRCSIVSIYGCWKASRLYTKEQQQLLSVRNHHSRSDQPEEDNKNLPYWPLFS